MMTKPIVQTLAGRIILLLLISVVFVLGLSELAYRFQQDSNARAPKVMELIIPEGTAQKIAAGERSVSIPESMAFVVGDELLVKNNDLVDHQLGPVWIPAGMSASLLIDNESQYSMTCSFQPTEYFGFDVHPPVTWLSRMTALWFAVPATFMLLFVYSFVVYPIKASPKQAD
jgi:hypothetical protein